MLIDYACNNKIKYGHCSYAEFEAKILNAITTKKTKSKKKRKGNASTMSPYQRKKSIRFR